MAFLFILTVFMTMLYMNPEMLIAAVIQSVNEGSEMMKEVAVVLVKPISTVISAIWCSCLAAGAVPRFI